MYVVNLMCERSGVVVNLTNVASMHKCNTAWKRRSFSFVNVNNFEVQWRQTTHVLSDDYCKDWNDKERLLSPCDLIQ